MNSSFSKNLKNVSILDMKFVNEQLEVKLKTEESLKDKNDLYFFIYLNKTDVKFNEKLAHLFKKIYNPKYSLDLEIKSFSEKPAGSMYFGEAVSMPEMKVSEPFLN